MDVEAQPSGSEVPSQGLPLRDMGSFVHTSTISDAEIKDHRSNDAVYVSLHVPRHRGHRRGRHRHGHRKSQQASEHSSVEATPPSQLVQFLLGEDDGDDDPEHKIHAIFCEMAELFTHGNEMQWKETARWIKFEEDVEEGGERWSKPHVATLSLHSLFELRSCIQNGTVLLDMDAQYFDQVIDLILDQLVAVNQLEITVKDNVRDVLLQRHRHLNEKHEKKHDHSSKINLPIIRSIADIGRKYSLPKDLSNHHDKADVHDSHQSEHTSLIEHHDDSKPQKPKLTGVKTMPNFHSAVDNDPSPKLDRSATLGSGLKRNQSSGNDLHNHDNASSHKLNLHFMKKIPPDAESANVLVGEVDFLNHQIVAFIRLSQSSCFGDLTEVPVPTKFIFILLGPTGHMNKYHEIGRSIATLMSDEIFHGVAYHARNTEDLLAGIDEFLDQVTVLPPGEWDPSIRIEPPKNVPSQDSRITSDAKKPMPNGKAVFEEVDEGHGDDPALQRTGRLFGGLIQDIKRKVPFYWSDIKDALHIQCLASFMFLYFACLTPVITFGGLLGDATNNNLAAFESLLAGAIVGITYALCSGQPLTILGSTGPVLVFETIVYNFCDEQDLDYLSFRWWIGMWTGLMLITIVAFDLSALVRYITRFTEESFAALISLIFIKEAFAKLIKITEKKRVNYNSGVSAFYDCVCVENGNVTSAVNATATTMSSITTTIKSVITSAATGGIVEWHKLSRDDCSDHGGLLVGDGCHYVADVFFLSVLLFLGTFTISYFLKGMKTGRFFPTTVRTLISDFSVVIAIICMIVVDAIVGLDTPKLEVPEEFTTTNPNRSWVISPFVPQNPWWISIVAVVPALLATILLFMDQQITAVIVNRRENKLKKGCGYHLDLLITSVLIMVNSCLGLPWYVAATVLSINHVMSLTKESECTAPGERPKFLGVRENRVTAVLIFLLIGLSVFLTKFLKYIPMPVLYGVFLYMGVSSLKGMQLVNRIMIFFMPIKYQPDYAYLRHVRTFRVHFFTVIQIVCLVLLWVIKTVKSISIAFPLMVLAMCFVRKGLDWVFTQYELKWLDDIMPEIHKREKEDKDKEKLTTDDSMDAMLDPKCSGANFPPQSSIVNLPLTESNADSLDSSVNITEEMSKTAIWKNLQSNNSSDKSLTHETEFSSKSSSNVDPKTSILKHKKRSNKHKNSEDKLPTIPSSPVDKDPHRSRKGEKSIAFYIDEDDHNNVQTPTIVVDPPSSEVRARFFSDDSTNM